MPINLSRGFWRLWLFFSFIWVVGCAWQVYDARAQITKAEALESYYTKANVDARRLELHSGATPISSIINAHLAEQVDMNAKLITDEHARDAKFFRLMWLVPLVTLVFARGIPWVWEGFIGKP